MSEDLLFSKTHEWARVERDAEGAAIATVGISAFAIQLLTDLVYIELPQPGRRIAAGEPFGEIESVKAVSDLYSPISGEIVAVNSELVDHLDRLSADPYGAGWLMKIRISDEAGLRELLDAAAYQKQCEEAGGE